MANRITKVCDACGADFAPKEWIRIAATGDTFGNPQQYMQYGGNLMSSNYVSPKVSVTVGMIVKRQSEAFDYCTSSCAMKHLTGEDE